MIIVIEYFKFLDCLILSMPEPSNKNKISVYHSEIKCLKNSFIKLLILFISLIL